MLDNEFYRGGEEWAQSSDLKVTLEPARREPDPERSGKPPKKSRKKAFKTGLAGILTVTVLSTALMVPVPAPAPEPEPEPETAETVPSVFYCGICGAPDCPYWVPAEKYGQGDAEGLVVALPPEFSTGRLDVLMQPQGGGHERWADCPWVSPMLDFGRRVRLELDFSLLNQPGSPPFDSCQVENLVNTKLWYCKDSPLPGYEKWQAFQKDEPAAAGFWIYQDGVDGDADLSDTEFFYLQLLYSPGPEPPPEGFGMNWDGRSCVTVPVEDGSGIWPHFYYRVYAESTPEQQIRKFLAAVKIRQPESGERFDLGRTMVLQESAVLGLMDGVSHSPVWTSHRNIHTTGAVTCFAFVGRSCAMSVSQADNKNKAEIQMTEFSMLDVADHVIRLNQNAGASGHRVIFPCRQLEDLTYRGITYRVFLVEGRADGVTPNACILKLIPLQEPQISISLDAYIHGSQAPWILTKIHTAHDFSRLFPQHDWMPVLDCISPRTP